MADLLLELFSEEIPARMQAQAEAHLAASLTAKLGQKAVSFSSPRRLAVWIQNLPAVQPDVNTELKGPRAGAPQAAIDGFLKKSGLTLSELTQEDGVYVAKIHQKGKPTAELLKPIIEEILAGFPWPKSMRWGSGDAAWVRPLHSILCVFDGKVVPVEFAGIKAGNITYGHRFLAPAPIAIDTPTGYEAALNKAYVMASRDVRKAEILRQANEVAMKAGLLLRGDEGLLEEVTGLVEWPVVLMGTIDASYMDLPPEVLISEMRAHQKYFALETKDGRFSDKFLITANMTASDGLPMPERSPGFAQAGGKAIVAGNERVLRARLADGRFFWDSDRKKKLEDWAKGLESVTYHAKLGSVAQKVERVKKLALELADYSKADKKLVERAAQICKADLVTGMVGEFPELQGVMGRYYALAEGEKPEVADAIRDHYLPLGPSSAVPTAPVSIGVALADKLDTLCSMFAIGEKPTGSKDPFALRRAALGVIRIILENNLRLPLKQFLDDAPFKDIALREAHHQLIKKTEAKLHENPKDLKVGKYVAVNESATQDIAEDAASSLSSQLLAFFHDRLVVQLKDSGIRHDVIKAVIAGGDDDLVRIRDKAKAVQAFLETDDGKNLLAGYKRAANILSIEEKKDKTTYQGAVVSEALKEPAELALGKELNHLAVAIADMARKEQFTDMMNALSKLRKPLDVFFDSIMVNCEDAKLRASRLSLLKAVKINMDIVADFSKIEG
ncbi:MAG: glycine--tRNA ligase subunit beta [Alphaproteobacteria bacterium]|nr:glycine--tRNA ligase subunit beta [Alphaproteobacteria bacterium]